MLVNLFVALIVSDVAVLKKDARKQELVNMARHVIQYGRALR